MFQHRLQFIVAAVLAVAGGSASACATCGCSLSSDGATGFSTATGWRLSVQYDFINQSQLRTGTQSIPTSAVAAINNAGGDQEVEHDTLNRYTTLGIGYAPTIDWGVRLFIPYIDRAHSTFASATNPVTGEDLSTAQISGLGDVRLVGNYQGFLPDKNFGVQLGIKLPTGDYGGPNTEGTGIVGHHPTAFSQGPLSKNDSPDNLVDTSLQPGTGTTDIILGAYYHRPVSEDFSAFVNAQFQSAVAHKLNQAGADFRVGNTTLASFGVRYEAEPTVVPQLQVNISHKSADQGALADNPDSAGTIIYVSPGVTGTLSQHWQAFGFVQVPVFSHLIGYQLAPRWTGTAGLIYSF